MNETTFENKCAMLSQLWIEHRTDPGLEDFIAYNDLGLPLAYAFANNAATPTGKGKDVIGETFALLLEMFDIQDEGWTDLDSFWDTINDIGLNN
jgi:hypothetical protein